MRRATALRRRSFLEGLESRQVLSGLVGAVLEGDTLTITGDDANNQIAIYAGDTAGDVIVAGGTDDDGETLINDTADPATFTGVTNVVLDLKGGDDTAVVTNLDLSGDLTADLGDGDDQLVINGTAQNADGDDDDGEEIDDDSEDDAASIITLNGNAELVAGAVSIGGDVSVTGGAGSDSVVASSATVAGDVTIDGEDGRDLLSISDATIGGSLTANMGAGDDSVAVVSSDITGDVTVDDSEAFSRSSVMLRDVTIGGDVTLTLSDKADRVSLRNLTAGTDAGGGAVSIDTAAGNDKVSIRNLTAADLSVLAGGGVDRVQLRGSDIAGDAAIDLGTDYGAVSVTGSTADSLDITSTSTSRGVQVRLSNVEAVDAVLTLGGGNDLLAISGSDFETLAADLGAGRDTLLLRSNDVSTTTTLNGGDGQDRLLKLKRNTLHGLANTNFERTNGHA